MLAGDHLETSAVELLTRLANSLVTDATTHKRTTSSATVDVNTDLLEPSSPLQRPSGNRGGPGGGGAGAGGGGPNGGGPGVGLRRMNSRQRIKHILHATRVMPAPRDGDKRPSAVREVVNGEGAAKGAAPTAAAAKPARPPVQAEAAAPSGTCDD
jgi:hypothetical protein